VPISTGTEVQHPLHTYKVFETLQDKGKEHMQDQYYPARQGKQSLQGF
jgi:hypothetical protein